MTDSLQWWLVIAIALTSVACSPAVEENDVDDGIVIEFDENTLDLIFRPDHLVQVELEMEPDDFEALRNQSRSFVSEFAGEDCRDQPFESPYTYFHAAITIDGQSLPDVGIRKKGFIGSQSVDKPGFRINLDEWVDGASLFGTDNITLNNGVQDPALVRQCLSYGLFRKAGHPAPRCSFALVRMNGEDLGIYVHVEPVKRMLLRDYFPTDDGDLYEGTISDFAPGWTETFEPKNYDTDPELNAIRDITARLEAGEDPQQVIEEYFDVDAMLTQFALEAMTGHWDGYAGNRNNFYLYRDPLSGLFTFIPWGTDGTFRGNRVDEPFVGAGVLAAHVIRHPELSERFDARLRELVETVWNRDELHAEIDRMVELVDVHAELEPEAIENVRRFVDRRADVLLDTTAVPREPEPPFCMIEQGTIDAEFETTWGTLGEGGDLTQVGSVELDVESNEQGPIVPVRAGVAAGISNEGDPLLAVVALIDPPSGTLLIWYLGFDPERVRPGEPIPIGTPGEPQGEELVAGGGLLFTNNQTQGLQPAGFMSGGQLVFDAFGTEPGADVRGRFSASILNWGEVDTEQ